MMTFDKLRAWQRRFVGVFAAWLEATFLLVALPGGGKTIAALFVANRWKRAPSEEAKKKFIVVVVPSVHLKRQWQKAAKKNFGLELQTEEFTGVPKSGMDGVVTTYAGLVKGSLLYNLLCARHEIFVVLDEVHHVGANAAWGAAVMEAFKDAVMRLAMSGTPWRSDGGNIPFLTPDPETGGYEVQERFDWPEALTGKPPAIRDLAFKPYHGIAEFRFKGISTVGLSSRDDLSEEDVARCLRGRVLSERFCTNILRDAHAKLMALRETKPNAAGIIVCIDIEHARRWPDGCAA